jgi:hypothetical protein
MITIELFLLLAAVVVVIGLVVRRRDIASGQVTDTTQDEPALSTRERFADTGFMSSAAWKARFARPTGGSAGRGRRAAGSPDGGDGGGAG